MSNFQMEPCSCSNFLFNASSVAAAKWRKRRCSAIGIARLAFMPTFLRSWIFDGRRTKHRRPQFHGRDG